MTGWWDVGVWCAGANETEKDVLMSASGTGDVMGAVWVWGVGCGMGEKDGGVCATENEKGGGVRNEKNRKCGVCCWLGISVLFESSYLFVLHDTHDCEVLRLWSRPSMSGSPSPPRYFCTMYPCRLSLASHPHACVLLGICMLSLSHMYRREAVPPSRRVL